MASETQALNHLLADMGAKNGEYRPKYGKTVVSCHTTRPGQYTTFIRWDDGTHSPYFDDLAGLYPWMRQNGIVIDEHDESSTPRFTPWRVRQL